MISLRKLAGLPAPTRRRKVARLLERFVGSSELPSPRFLEGLCRILHTDSELPESLRDLARSGLPDVRAADRLRHELLLALDLAPGDWDLVSPAGYGPRTFDETASHNGAAPVPVVVYLDSVRSPFNAGSVVRTAAALGVAKVVFSPECPSEDHRRFTRSSMGAEQMIGISRGGLLECVGADANVVALELGGIPLTEFRFPNDGVLLVGSEELGIRPEYLARATSCVSIPMYGAKASLNLSVACGIALHAWCSQLRSRGTPRQHG